MKNITLKKNQISVLEYILIIGFALIPLFFSFPYRVNIFLSWEGAYRLSLGQIPYKDFGLPMGFAFWVIPAFFFKVFGPYLITLVKAQVAINIISGFAFRSILKSLEVITPVRFLCILVFCISYSFFNFWPWYDQSVIVFEFVAISFTLKAVFAVNSKWRYINLALGSLFLFISLFTKQDGGGLAFLLCFALVLYHAIIEKKILPLILFIGFYIVFALVIILPFVPHHFFYWFNYGQPYQNTRLSIFDIIFIFFNQSDWIKFYLLIVTLLIIYKFKKQREFLRNKRDVAFALLTLGILAEAAIFQVTSYTPPDNNIFFHSFAFAYIFSNFEFIKKINFYKFRMLLTASLLIMVWWSGAYWEYVNRIVKRHFPVNENTDPHKVSIRTYMNGSDTSNVNSDMTVWVYSDLNVFKRVYMPKSTVEGMERLINMPIIKENGKNLKVLNMTELTPLAYEIGYKLETGSNIPLWYHKGVGMFQKEVDEYCTKIQNHYYDLVMFENIPELNNFYPFEVRDTLLKYYKEVDSFSGPRRGQYSEIEVFIRPEYLTKELNNNP